ncbi:MAG: hypothetical protein KDC39_00350 [Actinobacteria bacterium]|nr:hypothetical protein [Actinomycetota bacterium]
MPTSVIPPGWPRDLPPAASAEFEHKVAGWLLDRAPMNLRGDPIWRQEPRALALVTRLHAEATVVGLRSAYSSARRELSDVVDSDHLPGVMSGLERAGAEAVSTVREVKMVEEALAGRTWRRKL